MTLADFREDLRYSLGGANTADYSTGWLDRRINQTYLWVSMPNHYRHPELEATEYLVLVADTAEYATANTYYMIYGVAHIEDDTNPPPVTARSNKLDPTDMRELMTIDRQERQPRLYCYWNNEIVTASVPDTTSVGQLLEVRGYQQPDILGAVGTATVLKPEWDEIITKGAEWRGWSMLNEADRALEAKQEFGAMVNEIADVRRALAEDWGWQNQATGYTNMRTD